MKKQANSIKSFIINKITTHPSDIVALTASHFNVTRTTVHRHLNVLLKAHHLIKSGTTRNIKYCLPALRNRELFYKIVPALQESTVLRQDFDDIFQQFSVNIYDICEYGFTEIFNNAIEHSQGSKITAATCWKKGILSIVITDNGMGVFKNISDYFKLDDIRESILQLNKGKMTTDPENHTGEGIFFCARIFDLFEIYANNLHYIRDNKEKDWSIECSSIIKAGSRIIMSIDVDAHTQTQLTDVFKKYQSPESLVFDSTEIVVELSIFGEETLISRSQAKRIIRSLEKFNYIILDFKGVRLVGQGFVDEIFRIFAKKYPNVNISYINANDDVVFMIERGLGQAS